MPGLGRFPCTSCRYVAGNRRMLARHAVLTHSEKVFKCPLCPFITRYAANWYRHKRDLHGLTKITNCEICGFFANSTIELAQHKESRHPEHLHLEKYEDKYAKEKLRLTDSTDLDSLDPVEEVVNNLEPDISIDICDIKTEINDDDDTEEKDDEVRFSLPANGLLDTSEEVLTVNGHSEEKSSGNLAMNDAGSSVSNLGPLKVKRSYSCDQCGLLTGNPREFLYHQRNIHGEKINIFECKYCIYASKHVQKLHRHCNLVHRPLLEKDPDYKKHLEASKKSKQPDMFHLGLPLQTNASITNQTVQSKKLSTRRTQVFFKCSACDYKTRNKSFLLHHEKTVHLKKKFYRCLQCGYVTNEKGRYTKHIKYHSLPKMQCEFCFFKTAYKWNMDRHMKNHEEGAEGTYHCTECNFTTSTRQSFKAHVTHHHNANNMEEEEEFLEDENGLNDSPEWVDVEIIDDNESSMPMDENIETYDFPETRETSDTVWKEGKVYQKTLKCKSCDFKAAWPFELKKHEETHRSQKKHPCPLCGMRFEHIAWLTKHLRRVHQENSQAGNIAAAFDLMKPNRRRPAKDHYTTETVLPMFQQVLKQNPHKPTQQPSQNSMLSTLLNKPLSQSVPSTTNQYTFKSKAFAASTNMSRHLRISSYGEKNQGNDVSEISITKTKTVPTCNVCGYKTRWLSELQRHMRVHSQEKPFHCHKCKYHCKWKGDLNRHLMKYHGIKVPSSNKKYGVSRLKYKNSKVPSLSDMNDTSNDWQTINQEPDRNHLTSSTPLRKTTEESPLDLTTNSFSSPGTSSDIYDPYDFESFSVNDTSTEPFIDLESEETSTSSNIVPYKSPLQQLSEQPVPGEDANSIKRKYQCPFCTFGTTTASRFHVHIVQHYNRRPFMCSVCNHSSNWEWDITKHIRLKGCRDKFHNKACVLLTDETGRRNYEKYEKYLVDINYQPPSGVEGNNFPEVSDVQELEARRSLTRQAYVEPSPTKNCSYDFRNIGSNFEDTPENIVVTPDINIPDQSEVLGAPSDFLYDNQINMLENSSSKGIDSKLFICKHCDFKHATKRVVVSHLSLHAGIKPFRCRACGITSNWRHVIVRHVKDAHNGYMNEVEDRISYVQEGFTLRLTSFNPSNRETGNFESEKNQPNQFFECKICPYKCDKEFYMKFHMKQHRPREGAVFRCDYCPYFVKFKKTLVRHLKLHNVPSADYNVIDTGNGLPSTNNYNGNQSFTDQNNGYNYYTSQGNDSAEDSIAISFDTLNQFISAESSTPQKIKRHVCESCPYKTDNKTQYLYHKQFHRPNPTAPFKCSVCTYWATMQHLLTQHMKVHESSNESEQPSPRQRQFKAAPERTKFDDEETYDKMSVVYVKRGDLIVKMFKCGYCPMMNKKKANVRVHQKMHGVIVNNGKFACSYCDYQCLNQGGLTNHIKIHQKVPEKMTIIEEHGMEYENTRKRPGDTSKEDTLIGRKKIFSYFCTKCPALFKSSNDLEIHTKFHGSALPFPCTHCDYRAKHKPHLYKHLSVHGPDYVAKRNASQGPPVNSENEANSDYSEASNISIVKKIDQMLLLEASELNTALKKTGHSISNLHRCLLCPAVFIKTSTLVYHTSLHGSDGEYKCSQCDYAVNRAPNLTTHVQVHPKKTPTKKLPPPRRTPLKSFPCPKCPAVFYKQDRYDRHFNLHGKNWKFACDQCDYSVRFAANLIKHKQIHVPKPDSENISPSSIADNNSISPALQATQPLSENTNIQELDERKLTYICDRCPYSQSRRDAVQSHMRRHWLRDGFKCPYCDYSSMQSSFLQNHIKMHIQPHQLFPAQCFMKYESFKIWCKEDNGGEVILFDDEEMVEDLPDDESDKGIKRGAEEENCERLKTRKLSCDSSTTDSSYSDSKSKVPVVVLSDIFTSKSKDINKWVPKLKIPKLKITKSHSGEKMYTKINISDYGDEKSNVNCKTKPSLVVKISKVENCNNHEKAMYSISTKSSEDTFSSTVVSQSTNCSSINNCISEPLVQNEDTVSNDIDDNGPIESGLTSVSVSESDKVDFTMDSVTDCDSGDGESAMETMMEEKCNPLSEPLIGVTVSFDDISNDKLSNLTDITFNDESLTNAETTAGMTNGLSSLPEEITVKL